MATTTKIEWTDHTFNPWIGCAKVHAGCTHCYAEAFAKRTGKAQWGPQGTRVKTSEAYWLEPLQWNREAERAGVRRRVFCASLADVFEDWRGMVHDHRGRELRRCVDDESIIADPGSYTNAVMLSLDHLRRDLFALIDATPYLDWLLLTKRPENVPRMWCAPRDDRGESPTPHSDGRANVWLGCSVSDQATAARLIPALLQCRDLVPVLFLSLEPLLGPVDLTPWLHCAVCHEPPSHREFHHRGASGHEWSPTIDWVIVGGESGPRARPMHPGWVRSLRGQCDRAAVAFHFKQWGEWLPWDDATLYDRGAKRVHAFEDNRSVRVGKCAAGRRLDGREWNEFPPVEACT